MDALQHFRSHRKIWSQIYLGVSKYLQNPDSARKIAWRETLTFIRNKSIETYLRFATDPREVTQNLLKSDPIHRLIVRTSKRFTEKGFTSRAALEASVLRRRYIYVCIYFHQMMSIQQVIRNNTQITRLYKYRESGHYIQIIIYTRNCSSDKESSRPWAS